MTNIGDMTIAFSVVAVILVGGYVIHTSKSESLVDEADPEPDEHEIRALAQKLYEERILFSNSEATDHDDWHRAREILMHKAKYPPRGGK